MPSKQERKRPGVRKPRQKRDGPQVVPVPGADTLDNGDAGRNGSLPAEKARPVDADHNLGHPPSPGRPDEAVPTAGQASAELPGTSSAEVHQAAVELENNATPPAAAYSGSTRSTGSGDTTDNTLAQGMGDKAPLSPTAAELRAKRVAWLWPGYIPFDAATLLAGQTGSGKSTIATAVAVAVTGGCQLPGQVPSPPASVLWFTTEEVAAREVKARLHAAGADLNRVYFPELTREQTRGQRWYFPLHEQELLGKARQVGARLIVFDAITGYCPTELLPDSGQAARLVMESLARIGEATGAALLAIKHPRKGTTGSAIEQVAGSMEWVNVPRSVLMCDDWPEGGGLRVLSAIRSKLGPAPPSIRFALVPCLDSIKVDWRGQTSLTSEQLLECRGDAASRDTLADAKRFLVAELDPGERRTKDLLKLAEESGIGKRTLERAKAALKVPSCRVAFGSEGYYVWRKPAGGWPE